MDDGDVIHEHGGNSIEEQVGKMKYVEEEQS